MSAFLVFGASGRTGGQFVELARAAGHEIAVFVRDAAKAPPHVDVCTGDVLDAAAVATAIDDANRTIIITLGGIEALTQGCANVIHAAQAAGVHRILGVVGAGVLQADATRKRHELPDYPSVYRIVGTAHQAFLTALDASKLDWTLACTPTIIDGAPTGRVTTREDYLPDGSDRVTTGDVAAFLLAEAVEGRFLRRRVGLNTAR